MQFAREPRWDVTPAEAAALQRELAPLVVLEDAVTEPGLVAGVDLGVGRFGELGRGAVVVWRPEDGAVVEEVAVELPITMPYIPGLLAFREGPLVEAALRALRTEPDLLLFDGQGIAHPRRFGIAAHVGVLLDRPTIGIGKTRLFGHAAEPGSQPGDREPLLSPEGECLGAVLRTRAGSRPLYVSPGHRVAPESAAELVWRCVRGHRLPEPVFLADRLSKARGAAA